MRTTGVLDSGEISVATGSPTSSRHSSVPPHPPAIPPLPVASTQCGSCGIPAQKSCSNVTHRQEQHVMMYL